MDTTGARDGGRAYAPAVFPFGEMRVEILQGDILKPGVPVEAVASADDNYLTMGGGVSARLRDGAGDAAYVRKAQAACPVRAGSVVVTPSYGLKGRLGVDWVLHAAVIDYDTERASLADLVEQVTANCLAQADARGLHSLLLPAFATGAGKLDMAECARRMGLAIKTYAAHERCVTRIYVILYLPNEADGADGGARLAECQALNARYLHAANLVLGTPYHPVTHPRQIRDFYGREAALRRIEAVIAGQVEGKRHLAILGGPKLGKATLLDQVIHRARQDGSPLNQGRRLVRVTFGRVHQNTPAAFIYRKLLYCLGEGEGDGPLGDDLRTLYANPDLTCSQFLGCLDAHAERYPQVVFLVDHLPQLLEMGAEKDFWRDLHLLGGRVRFIFTASDDGQYAELGQWLSRGFREGLDELRLGCVSDAERRGWVNALYRRYLGSVDAPAPEPVQAFFAREAGQHPFLISLAGHALVEALKRDVADAPSLVEGEQAALQPFFQAARTAMERPRQAFFDQLLTCLDATDQDFLRVVAGAIASREAQRQLPPATDSRAVKRWLETLAANIPLQSLDPARLGQFRARGYLVEVGDPPQTEFMAEPFAAYVKEHYGAGRPQPDADQPRDVMISLSMPEPAMLHTWVRTGGARVSAAQKPLSEDLRKGFVAGYRQFLQHRMHPAKFPEPGPFRRIEDIASHLLNQFATGDAKRGLMNPPLASTLLLEVDDALRDVPWELMLEAVYTGEIPFRVGRRAASAQPPGNLGPPVRGEDVVRALLIGNPTGDLDAARLEVQDLAQRLRATQRFAVDLLVGEPECQRLQVMAALQSGQYGLVHYSGHTLWAGSKSAWHLADGALTTDQLTSALLLAPPALVFSSSCQSAAGGAEQPVEYENQTFDLPSAFLQAGVEAYIGTLWEVDAEGARRFVAQFYEAFLSGELAPLGECLRRAKGACKHEEQAADRINWLAFILYGDPHRRPGDLFPALRQRGEPGASGQLGGTVL